MTTLQLFFALAGLIAAQSTWMFFALNRIDARLLSIEADLRRFYQFIGEHGGKIEMIEKKLNG